MYDLDLGALDAWITGEPPDEPDYEDENERYLADEAKCAAMHTDADLLVAYTTMVTHFPPTHPALPVWRDEARRRGLVLP